MRLRVLFRIIILCVPILCSCRTILTLQEQNFPVVDIDLSSSKEEGNRINFIHNSENFIF